MALEVIGGFNDALSIQDEEDQRQIADLRYRKGQALRSLGRWEEAIEEWQQVLAIQEALGDRVVIAKVGQELAYLAMWATNRTTDAVHTTRHLLEVVGPEASADRCRLLAIGGWGLGLGAERSDEVVAVDDMLSQSIAMAETLGDPRAHGEALWATAYNHWFCMRRREQADTALRAAELLRAEGDLWNMADVLALFKWRPSFRGGSTAWRSSRRRQTP